MILPSMIIFGIRVLFPFDPIANCTKPFVKLLNGKIIDNCERYLDYYPQIPEILSKINDDYKIPMALRYDYEIYKEDYRQLVEVFQMKHYFLHKVCDRTDNTTAECSSFSNLRRKTLHDYEGMLLFDKEDFPIECAEKSGIFHVMVDKSGMTMNDLKNGLVNFSENYKKLKSKVNETIFSTCLRVIDF